MTDPQYKAIGFLNMLTVLQRELSSFSEFVSHLTPETQALVRVPPSPKEWIPLRVSRDLIETSFTHAYGGDLRRSFELGRQSQQEGIDMLFRVFIRVLRPHLMLQATAHVWGSYYRGNGAAEARSLGSHVAELQVRGVVIGSPRYWEMLRGTFFAFGEATRVGDLSVRAVAGGGESSDCTYRFDWS